MGKLHKEYLDDSSDNEQTTTRTIVGCARCNTHFSTTDKIISKSFQGQHGRAYLMERVVNIRNGHCEDRYMSTGMHRVCDIFCVECEQLVGWKYVKSHEPDQKYKEGRFVLEAELLRHMHSVSSCG